MLPSFLEVVFPSMKGWFLCAVPHFMRLVVPGSHGLFFGVFPGSHGSHGGMSRFIQDSRGPLSLYSLGTEEAGTASSLIEDIKLSNSVCGSIEWMGLNFDVFPGFQQMLQLSVILRYTV